jgi:hypothetical protein
MSLACEGISYFVKQAKACHARIQQLEFIISKARITGAILTTSKEDLQDGLVEYAIGSEVILPYLENELSTEKSRAQEFERKASMMNAIIDKEGAK